MKRVLVVTIGVSVAAAAAKRAGNFNKLLVVKISDEFQFEARIIDRKSLKKAGRSHARASWESMPKCDE